MSPYYSQLTKEEQMRNKYGPFNIFSYSKKALGKCESNYFPAVSKHARVELKNREDIVIPRKDLIQGLYPGLKLDEYFPGFPSLQHIKHTAKLEKAKVSTNIYTFIIFVFFIEYCMQFHRSKYLNSHQEEIIWF